MKTFKKFNEAFQSKKDKIEKIKGYKVRYQNKGSAVNMFVGTDFVGKFKNEVDAKKNAIEFIQFMEKSK